jgi:UMF1 family MFS transporter
MAEAHSASSLAAADATPVRAASPLGQFAWALFDGARSPYNVLVNIFVFSAYFSTVVIPDPVRGQVLWSYITAGAALMVAIGAPILGAIADAGGRRKPWLAACMIIGLPLMAGLWFATPGMTSGLGFVIIALLGGYLFFEYSAIFCNAMLPNIAPPARIGFLSGLGLALGNVSGIILFLFFLVAWSWSSTPWFGLDVSAHEPERAVGLLAAVWMAIFGLPLFFFTPDSPGTRISKSEAIRQGLSNLAQTIRRIREYRNIVTFLVARMIYNEGFLCLMLFTGVFASGILGWNSTMLVAEGLINSVVAAVAGLFAGWLDMRLGSKRATAFFVGGCLLANLILVSITRTSVFFVDVALPATPEGLFPTLPDKVFLVTQCSVAFFVTGGLVTSRSLMAKLAPQKMLIEFFGLFAMSGTAVAFVGPLVIGQVTSFFGNQRSGVAVGLVFLAIGLLGLFKVQEQKAAG